MNYQILNNKDGIGYLAGIAAVLVLYFLFVSSLDTHPAGAFVDESCEAYNGYLIATTGRAENGTAFPAFFQCFTAGYTQWMSPLLIYSYAGLFTFVAPTTHSARIFSATFLFIATLILGLLAFRITGRRWIGIVVAVSAMTTPWIFEVSRLIQETSVLGFAAALFLLMLYRSYERTSWTTWDVIGLAISLTLITYAYAAGRVVGPALGLGLLIFVRDRRSLFDVLRVGALYAIMMIPFLVVYLTRPSVISARFTAATNLDRQRPLLENIGTVVSAFVSDLSPYFFLFEGDNQPRHHIPGMGEFLFGTFIIGLLGVLIVLLRARTRWWMFVIFGSFVSLLPGALTYERHHALRDFVFPFFFLTLTIPAIEWLSQRKKGSGPDSPAAGWWRPVTLAALLTITGVQAVVFHTRYRELGDDRGPFFQETYPLVLRRALDEASRPIYLEEDATYIHALWYGAEWGVDPANFVLLRGRDQPPVDALVMNGRGLCDQCEKVLTSGQFLLYRNLKPPEAVGSNAFALRQFELPRGLAADTAGGFYVTDNKTAEVRGYGPDGRLRTSFTVAPPGGGASAPDGIVVDQGGSVWVTDAKNNRLLKYGKEGDRLGEWAGPDSGFYGPRDVTIGSNRHIYVLDQGRNRVVHLDPASETISAFGASGANDGEMREATGLGAGPDVILVADTGNARIQLFSLSGEFVAAWKVPEWETNTRIYPDVAYDAKLRRVYATDPVNKRILVFDADGRRLDVPLVSSPLDNPSMLAISAAGNRRMLYVLNLGDTRVIPIELSDRP